MKYDVFISHASEDKPDVVRPLADQLKKRGIKVWLDEHELTLGDSLRRRIDDGLANSRYGLVILSHAFFAKEWPQKELDSLVAREDGREKVILPVRHEVTAEDVKKYSLLLADKLSGSTNFGIDQLVDQVVKAIEVGKAQRSEAAAAVANIEVETTASDEAGPKEWVDANFSTLNNLVADVLDSILFSADSSTLEITGVRTGFTDLDSLTLGLHRGEVTLIAARPSIGKTSFVAKIARAVALDEGLPVAVFLFGTSSVEFARRLITAEAQIHTRNLSAGLMTEAQWQAFADATMTLRTANIIINDDATQNIDQIVERARKAAQPFGGTLGVLIVDGIQLVQADDLIEAEIARKEQLKKLRLLAKEIGCPILVTSQVNRMADLRADKRPRLTDVPFFNQAEPFIDNVYFLYRDLMRPSIFRKAEIIVAKQKRGPVGTVGAIFHSETGAFQPRTTESEEDMFDWDAPPLDDNWDEEPTSK